MAVNTSCFLVLNLSEVTATAPIKGIKNIPLTSIPIFFIAHTWPYSWINNPRMIQIANCHVYKYEYANREPANKSTFNTFKDFRKTAIAPQNLSITDGFDWIGSLESSTEEIEEEDINLINQLVNAL